MQMSDFLGLLGGLALFLYGMQMMSSGLEAAAGSRMKMILERLTANRFLGVLVGAAITAVIQSSSATTVMVVGFVNAGMMTLNQAVWIIMVANIGTTVTGLLIALDVGELAPLFAFVGVALVVFVKKPQLQHIGQILAGLGVLFIGMDMMSSAMSPLRESEAFINLMSTFSNPLLGILAGAGFTAVIQSSSASVGILQALANSGVIGLPSAVFVLFGQNIGTCVTAILSSIGVSRKAKRVPALHILIKILGTIIWLVLYIILRYILRLPIFNHVIKSFQIAVFHTIFNIGTIVILLPFSQKLVRLVERMVKVDENDKTEMEKYTLLDERLLLSPGLAVGQCREKTIEMAKIAREAFSSALSMFEHFDKEEIERIVKKEEELDYLEDELDTYLVRLSAKDMTESDSDQISEMLHCINDFERIGDHAINMTKLARQMHDQKLQFSAHAKSELAVLTEALNEIMTLTLESFEKDDQQQAKLIEPLEEVIDDLTKEIKNRHIDRLKTGECRVELGIILTDYITNCERVSDHCSNVGVCIIQTKNSSFETHG